MAQYGQMMNQGAMSPNGSDPNQQPPYNGNFGPQAPVHNGYPGYAQPPYYPNYASQGSPAPTPHPPPPYGYYPPHPSYNNNGYYNYPVAHAQPPVRRLAKPRTPVKPKPERNGPKNVSYRVAGNRVSGNTGDNNGVFNVGNKNVGSRGDDAGEGYEY